MGMGMTGQGGAGGRGGAGVSRRSVLASGLAAAGAAALGGGVARAGQSAGQASGAAPGGARRVLRFAHVTDSHVQQTLRAEEGFAACLRHIKAMSEGPEFLFFGGDNVSAGMSSTRQDQQWKFDTFMRVLKAESALPTEFLLGNHDIWGWTKSRSGATGNEPDFGKKWAMGLYGMERPYRVFRRAGWAFVVLDSIQPIEEGYYTGLDDEQFEWLKGVLEGEARGVPTVVMSHAPILCPSALLTDARVRPVGGEAQPGLDVGRGSMFVDLHRVTRLFEEHPSVKLCLSGHIHTLERVEYNGVTYVCSGAVSGAWWRTPEADRERRARNNPNDPVGMLRTLRARTGFVMVDLFDDGSFATRYERYAWEPATA
jgi:3',5'-cyclic AMP phosphodiesterase CpdA